MSDDLRRSVDNLTSELILQLRENSNKMQDANDKITLVAERLGKLEHRVELLWKVSGIVGGLVLLTIVGALLKLVMMNG